MKDRVGGKIGKRAQNRSPVGDIDFLGREVSDFFEVDCRIVEVRESCDLRPRDLGEMRSDHSPAPEIQTFMTPFPSIGARRAEIALRREHWLNALILRLDFTDRL